MRRPGGDAVSSRGRKEGSGLTLKESRPRGFFTARRGFYAAEAGGWRVSHVSPLRWWCGQVSEDVSRIAQYSEREREFEQRATSDPVLARKCRCLACLEQSLSLCRHVTNIRPRRARVSPKHSTDDPARIKAYITATDAYKLLILYQAQDGLQVERIRVQPDSSYGSEYRQNSLSMYPLLLNFREPFQSRRHIPPGRPTSGA